MRRIINADLHVYIRNQDQDQDHPFIHKLRIIKMHVSVMVTWGFLTMFSVHLQCKNHSWLT